MKFFKIIFFVYLVTLASGAFAFNVGSKDHLAIVEELSTKKQCEVIISEIQHDKHPILGVPEELKYKLSTFLLLKSATRLNQPQEFHREFIQIHFEKLSPLTVLRQYRIWQITFDGEQFTGTSEVITEDSKSLVIGMLIGLFLCLILALIVISVAKLRKSTSYH